MTEKVAEFVSPKHPDKLCDLIADTILDAYLAGDKDSRVAVEVMGGHGLIVVNGEVTSNTKVDIESMVKSLLGDDFKVISNIVPQSHQIAQGVDTGGAGDQGIMNGYATNETKSNLPLEYELARSLCQDVYQNHPYDGKVQVRLLDGRLVEIVVSFQNSSKEELIKTVKDWYYLNFSKELSLPEIITNPAGDWDLGGFDADTGLSGRKIVIDNYGPNIAVGGGSFSGKDYTKLDRSGAYMARKIAVDLLNTKNAQEVFVKLAYVIGRPEPVMAIATIDGVEEKIKGYNLSPQGIYQHLKLDQLSFKDTANWGHFGKDFEWDKCYIAD